MYGQAEIDAEVENKQVGMAEGVDEFKMRFLLEPVPQHRGPVW